MGKVNVSKYIGVPASLKRAREQLKEITTGKERTVFVPKGHYLCFVKRVVPGGYTGKVETYPIFAQKTKKVKGALVCKRMPTTYPTRY